MAGVNMGSDLSTPNRSIPVGSLSAIISSYALHILFIIGLGITCTRVALLNDYSISQHVSALGLFLTMGLYMSALSSSLGSMYTAPRIMQNLAQELHSFPMLRCFASGKGPNKSKFRRFENLSLIFVFLVPINALIFFTLVTLAFVMIGGINVLAPIVTIPYLLTYATIEYAYFSMAMTFDIQISREKRFMAIATQLRKDSDDSPPTVMVERVKAKTPTEENLPRTPKARPIDADTVSLTPSLLAGPGPVPPSPTPSMQQQLLVGYGSVQSITQHIKIKRRQSTKSSDSGTDSGSDLEHDDVDRKKSTGGISKSSSKQSEQQVLSRESSEKKKPTKPKTIRQLMAAVSDDDDDDEDGDANDEEVMMRSKGQDSVFLFDKSPVESTGHQQLEQSERLLNPDPELAEIACKQQIWYLRVMNRWIVLIAAILKVVLMFSIAWHYALVTLVAFVFLYMLIGRTNPGFYPGVSEFVFTHWIRNCYHKLVGYVTSPSPQPSPSKIHLYIS